MPEHRIEVWGYTISNELDTRKAVLHLPLDTPPDEIAITAKVAKKVTEEVSPWPYIDVTFVENVLTRDEERAASKAQDRGEGWPRVRTRRTQRLPQVLVRLDEIKAAQAEVEAALAAQPTGLPPAHLMITTESVVN